MRGGREVLSSVIATQIDIHKRFGGVVPEIASRNHTLSINGVVGEALEGHTMAVLVAPHQHGQAPHEVAGRNEIARIGHDEQRERPVHLRLGVLDASHQIAVLEMGMDDFGQIDYLSAIVRPNLGIITNIGDAHIERLGSRENIFRAKCELLPHVRPGGLLVLNGDDPLLSTLRGNTPVSTVF